ncbi:MAG: transposase [Rikenellaceae bacterium]
MKDAGLDIEQALRRRLNWGKGEFPKEVSGAVCFGHNIDATVAYFSTLQNVPFARLTHLMEVLFGVKMSQGSISNILKRMRKRAQLPYEMIRKSVEQSKVVGADESGAKIDGKNHWMWTFQTEMASYLAINKSHGGKVVNSHFPDGFPDSTLVSDRLALYFNVVAKDHQICLAHLLRNMRLSNPSCRQPANVAKIRLRLCSLLLGCRGVSSYQKTEL